MGSFHEHKDDLRLTLLVRVGTTASFTTVSSVATTDTSTCTQRRGVRFRTSAKHSFRTETYATVSP